VKEKLWGEEFWTDGYFVNTANNFRDETGIPNYVCQQGIEKEYVVLHQSKHLVFFYDTPLIASVSSLKQFVYTNMSVGDFPKNFLKTVLKYPTLPNPHNSLTSVTVYFRVCKSSEA
jgi:hypothetical protein